MYGIDEKGMKADASPVEAIAMLQNKKPYENENMNQQAQQQGTALANPNNMPGNQTNSALAVLHRR
jgi:hypothetical protein